MLRAAVAIHAEIAEPTRKNQPQMSMELLHSCLRLQRLVRLAESVNRFPLAAQRLQKQLRSNCTLLEKEAFWVANEPVTSGVATSGLSEIRDDITALQEEFSSLQISLKSDTIAVVTETVVLEDVCLGRFQITLDWTSLNDRSAGYTVEALDPVPACTCDAYVHPHIDGDILCAGDGKAAIAAALKQRRLLDFFILVRQVLNTYNAGSAYVQLDDWWSTECRDCGDSVSANQMCCCDNCDRDLCRHCTCSCDLCSDTFCSDCTTDCADCGFQSCAACLTECAGCTKQICERCTSDGECQTCYEHEEEESTTEVSEDTATAADNPVHPVFMEQTAVSA
jgi:hypothetical protein